MGLFANLVNTVILIAKRLKSKHVKHEHKHVC